MEGQTGSNGHLGVAVTPEPGTLALLALALAGCALERPDPGKAFRRDNPLLFCTNRLRHIGQVRPHIQAILDETHANALPR